jgi:hypothetical protein
MEDCELNDNKKHLNSSVFVILFATPVPICLNLPRPKVKFSGQLSAYTPNIKSLLNLFSEIKDSRGASIAQWYSAELRAG